MKRILTLLIVLTGSFLLVSCGDKTLSRNLPVFKNTDSKAVISENLEKRNIDHIFIEEVISENPELDGMFSKYGKGLNFGDLIEEGVLVEVYIYKFIEQGLMFSKYYHHLDLNEEIDDKAIQLYNPSNKDINLADYKIRVYVDGETVASLIINLEGTLQSKKSLTIVNDKSSEELLAAADLVSEQLDFDGNEAIVITDRELNTIDTLSNKGTSPRILANKGIVRLPSITSGNTKYTPMEWTEYIKGYDEIITDKQYPLNPPTSFSFLEEDAQKPFGDKKGMIKVKFISNNDGDTAMFEVIDGQDFILKGDSRVRYIGIDTREMSSPAGSEDKRLAEEAKNYLYRLLSTAKEIYVQHDPSGLMENYGRHLGLVWADGVLTNYMMVKEGHSPSTYSDPTTDPFIYHGLSLENWFRAAEAEAKFLKKGIYA